MSSQRAGRIRRGGDVPVDLPVDVQYAVSQVHVSRDLDASWGHVGQRESGDRDVVRAGRRERVFSRYESAGASWRAGASQSR